MRLLPSVRMLSLGTFIAALASALLLLGVFREVRMVLELLNGGCLK